MCDIFFLFTYQYDYPLFSLINITHHSSVTAAFCFTYLIIAQMSISPSLWRWPRQLSGDRPPLAPADLWSQMYHLLEDRMWRSMRQQHLRTNHIGGVSARVPYRSQVGGKAPRCAVPLSVSLCFPFSLDLINYSDWINEMRDELKHWKMWFGISDVRIDLSQIW